MTTIPILKGDVHPVTVFWDLLGRHVGHCPKCLMQFNFEGLESGSDGTTVLHVLCDCGGERLFRITPIGVENEPKN